MNQIETKSVRFRRMVVVGFFIGLIMMAILAFGIDQVSAGWGSFNLGWVNHVIGAAVSVGGLALVVWAVHVQFVVGKGTPFPRVATRKLVTQGPYSASRNPMTLGALLIYLGIGILMGSGIVITLTLIVFSGLLIFIYGHETKELTERFGKEYIDYRNQTPFLMPRCRRKS